MKSSRLATALTILALVWGGSAQAYLSPDYTDPDLAPGGATPFTIGPGDVPDYLTSPNWAYSPPIRKFIDTLPGLGAANQNNLGQYIPVAVPDIVTYPGSDYYEIELVQFTEQMHSDLPPTTLRGYRQVGFATDTSGGCTDPAAGLANPCTALDNTLDFTNSEAHYLGPIIVSQKDRPVRVKFTNKLPTGDGGDLFIPVDTTVMGAGPFEIDYDPVTKEAMALTAGNFSQNRAELHLHGGRTPWISDGTPHQWITPAGDPKAAAYPKGISVVDVPDMPDPGPGAQTYYWTNQQSARLMFYHDHAWGITRLNVYVGNAAGYLIRDAVELDLMDRGIIPADEIPLVIQDKTYVDADTIASTDPTWLWGTGPVIDTINIDGQAVDVRAPNTGDLWWPHVYMPAQNPFDITGIAPMGRWAYGPYFWPPTNNPYQPVANPYYSPDCDPNGVEATTPGLLAGFCQPPEIPGTPNPSWGAEAFMDTPTVNGTAYPVLEVQPKAYRFRILNAADDRFFNLHMYIADPTPPAPVNTPENPPNPADFAAAGYNAFSGILASATEVRMVPASPAAFSTPAPGEFDTLPKPATWPEDGRPGGVPDWSWGGPEWIMIGSEGGFLPKPVVLPPQPLIWNNDVTTFNAGNVNGGSLILGPAERADVIVDFSAFAGKTLILYNDAPAPWPALDPHYDYYTDAPDNRAMGGADTTPIGFGPNVRTIMQIKVAGGAPQPFNLAALQAEFTSGGPGSPSVFEAGQDPIIAGQGNMNPTGDPAFYEAFTFDGTDFSAYNQAYNATYPATYPNWGISRIYDKNISFYHPETDDIQTVAMKTKAIQDEQGETFDDYGRMRAALGLELANPGAGQVNFIVQTYNDPSTEIVNPGEIQVWKITHNGVDTHPVHFHLYDVQVLNRVGWDGFIRLPDPTELGWKDTVRISPLEDTIVALKPVTPQVPFGVPESIRPLNPSTPLGDTMELSPVDPYTGEAWLTPNINRFYNFDWEYVWHCHILSHEENDMMRTQSFLFPENLPAPVQDLVAAPNGPDRIDLSWTDPTPADDPATLGNPANEIGFRIERSTDNGPFTFLADTLANATSYSDTTALAGSTYRYRARAYNASGIGPFQSDYIGLFRAGRWFLDRNGNNQWDGRPIDLITTFGLDTDLPVVGDWNGDGYTEIGVYRDGYWLLDMNGNGIWDDEPTDKMAGPFVPSPKPTDIPVAGDWNNDGITEIGVFRSDVRRWIFDMNGNGVWDGFDVDAATYFGKPGDVPVVGDWSGTGGDKIGVYRNGEWFLDINGNGVWDGTLIDSKESNFGAGNPPVVGDLNGNGTDWLGYFRKGLWYMDTNENSTWDGPPNDTLINSFGRWDTDIPVMGRWQ